ncbi:MAG: hypothetical protein B7Y83_05925 [Flavobacteriales bacterium 32-34-25]|nr:MAG: hypothetical protein B7Y83_05925 [Flavobacteriales bacterium 32-34-25]
MTTKKSLQKFTDYSSIKTLAQFQELFDKDPAEHQKCILWLQAELNKVVNLEKPKDKDIDKYFNLCEKAITVNGYCPPDKVDFVKEDFKNQRWNANEYLIVKILHSFTKDNSRIPTVLEIAQQTGLSRTTVHKHLLESDYTTSHKHESKEVLGKLRDKALGMIYAIGMQYNDIKTLSKFVELTTEKEPKNIKNYIQVNNTKIDNHFIENLPSEAQRQIEEIILLNQK